MLGFFSYSIYALPISGYWIQNKGQLSNNILYYMHFDKGRILIREYDIVFQFIKLIENPHDNNCLDDHEYTNQKSISVEIENIYLSFENSSFSDIIPKNPLDSKLNLFQGKESTKWVSDMSLYDRIIIRDIYKNTSLIIKKKGNDILCYFDKDPKGYYEQYARIDSDRKIHDFYGLTDLLKNTNIQRKNNIDYIVWGTYLGGAGMDIPRSMNLDSSNNIIFTGFTSSHNIPEPENYINKYEIKWDIFLAKMNSDGNDLLWAAIIGGDGNDAAFGVDTDSFENIIIAGYTESNNIPVINAYDSEFNGERDIYIAKIHSNGNQIQWATYIGGSYDDSGLSLGVDSQDNIIFTGWTFSPDIPVPNGLYTHHSGDADIYLAKLRPNGREILWGTYIGGNGNDQGRSIALDSNDNIILGGFSNSMDIPLINSIYNILNGILDMYIAKINSEGNMIYWSTYIGGSKEDLLRKVVIDNEDNIILGGFTNSHDIPVINGLGNMYRGYFDTYIAKLNPSGTEILWSNYIGGSDNDYCYSIDTDSQNNIILSSSTRSMDISGSIPINNADNNSLNIYLAKLNPAGNELLWDSFIIGENDDYCISLKMDNYDNIIIAGQTSSSNMPVPDGYDTSLNSPSDIYSAKINPFITENADPFIFHHDIILSETEDNTIIEAKLYNYGLEELYSGIAVFSYRKNNELILHNIADIQFGPINPLDHSYISAVWDLHHLHFQDIKTYNIIILLHNIIPGNITDNYKRAVKKIILPIELSNVYSVRFGSHTAIHWTTKREFNIKGYNIYRKSYVNLIGSLNPFRLIKLNNELIDAGGSLNSSYHYTFWTDTGPLLGNFFILEAITDDDIPFRWSI